MSIIETGMEVIKAGQALAANSALLAEFQTNPEVALKQIFGDSVPEANYPAIISGVKLELSAQGLLMQAVNVAENVGEQVVEMVKKVEKIMADEAATLVNKLSPGFSGKAAEVEQIVVTQFADMFNQIKAVFTDATKKG